MGELINGRTPEEIKQELQWLAYGCRESNTECDECIHAEICSNVTERDAPCNAIALIDRLESERDEALAKVPKWISVEERMPEHGTDVLVLTAPGTLSLGQNCVVAEYIHPRMEKYGVFINFYAGYDDKNILAVTHWMPLPEPPDGGKSNEDD